MIALYEQVQVRYPMSKMVVKLNGLPWIEEFASGFGIEIHRGSELLTKSTGEFDVVVLDYPDVHNDHPKVRDFAADALLAQVIDSCDSLPNADIHINPNLDGNRRWSTKPGALTLTGLKYALVRQVFQRVRATRLRGLHTPEHPHALHRILISMGGTDHRKIAPEVGRRLAEALPRQEFTVLTSMEGSAAGGVFQNIPPNMNFAQYTSNVIDALGQHDLVVTSAGSSLYNFFVAAVPTVTLATESDQVAIVERAIAKGLTSGLGDLGACFSVDSDFDIQFADILSDRSGLREKTLRAAQSFDGWGASRVLNRIEHFYFNRV